MTGLAGCPLINGVTLKTAGTRSVTVSQSNNGSITGSQTGITVTPGAAATLAVTAISDPVEAGTASNVTVTAKDAYNNTATDYAGTVAFSSSDTQAVLPGNYTFQVGDNGVKTLSSQLTLKTAGEQSVTATDTVTGSINGSQVGLTVTAAGQTKFGLSGIASGPAGTITSATVVAQDEFDNTVTDFVGTVTFSSTDSQAILPNDYTFLAEENGSHTFTNGFQLKTAGTQSVTVSDANAPSLTGVQSGITVTPLAAASLTMSALPGSVDSGIAQTITVTAKDTYNNTATGYTGTITFTSNDNQATLPDDYSFVGGDGGTKNFSVTFGLAGSRSVTATDTVAGSLTASRSTTVLAVPANALVITGLSANITAGQTTSFTVNVLDTNGNIAANYVGTVGFSSNDNLATLPSNYTFTAADGGSHTFTSALVFKSSGSRTLTVRDVSNATIVDNENTTVAAGSASSIAVYGITNPITAGVPSSVTVAVKDAYGNLVPTYTGTINFSSTDAQATLPGSYTFLPADGGLKYFNNAVIFKTGGSQSVTAADSLTSSLTGSQTGITVVSETTNGFTITNITNPIDSGSATSITITAKDSFGATVTGYRGTVRFVSSDPQATLPGNVTFTSANNGVVTLNSAITLKTSGYQSITVIDTSNSAINGTYSQIAVVAGPAVDLELSTVGSQIIAGQAYSVVLRAIDRFGNDAINYGGTVRFTSSDPLAALPANYSFVVADKGRREFTVTLKTKDGQSVLATDTGNSGLSASINTVVNPGVIAKYLVSTTTPQQAGKGWQEVVTAKDLYENTVTNTTVIITAGSSTNSVRYYQTNSYSDQTNTYIIDSSGQVAIYPKDEVVETVRLTVRDSNDRTGQSGEITVGQSVPVDDESNFLNDPLGFIGDNIVEGVTKLTTTVTTVAREAIEGLALFAAEHSTAVQTADRVLSIATPITAITALPSVGSGLSTLITTTLVKDVSIFQLLFVGFLPHKRRKRWGRVTSRPFGVPVPGIKVELVDVRGQTVRQMMTDRTGEYGFLLSEPGRYTIRIANPLYQTYQSSPILVNDPRERVLEQDIHLIPNPDNQASQVRQVKNLFKVIDGLNFIHLPLLVLGSIIAVYFVYIQANAGRFAIVGLYLLLWAVKLIEFRRPRPFGVVTDKATGRSLAGAVVQLTGTESGEKVLVHSTITDKFGRFMFVVKDGNYTVVAAKEGFSPREMRIKGETANISVTLEATNPKS